MEITISWLARTGIARSPLGRVAFTRTFLVRLKTRGRSANGISSHRPLLRLRDHLYYLLHMSRTHSSTSLPSTLPPRFLDTECQPTSYL